MPQEIAIKNGQFLLVLLNSFVKSRWRMNLERLLLSSYQK